MIIDYLVVCALGTYDLASIVRLYIEQGWQPIGGVTINDKEFLQSMVKYKEA